jgi:hypothetical protein
MNDAIEMTADEIVDLIRREKGQSERMRNVSAEPHSYGWTCREIQLAELLEEIPGTAEHAERAQRDRRQES